MQLITKGNALVEVIEGRPVTTSMLVAGEFERAHKSVLRTLENIECSEEFRRRNFAPREYRDERGKIQPFVEMTRDGYMFAVMGFTGAKAAKKKEAFILAFNQMEEAIRGAPGDISEIRAEMSVLRDMIMKRLPDSPKSITGASEFPRDCRRLRDIRSKYEPGVSEAVIARWLTAISHPTREFSYETGGYLIRTHAYEADGIEHAVKRLREESSVVSVTNSNYALHHPLIGSYRRRKRV